MENFLSFKLPDDFVNSYKERKVNWGFPIGGDNTLGEITFLTKYSRVKADGTKERWHDVCRRVVEGYYSILKDHCKDRHTNWNENKAQFAAQDAFERMFEFKWLPPGRGLWAMGTRMVNEDKNGSPLYNCSFLSTGSISSRSSYDATLPFARLMEMSMNGIGVSADTNGAGKITLHNPIEETVEFVVPDSREGWAESLSILLESFFFKNRKTVVFDYSLVRPAGSPVKRFGGVASGPAPLKYCHDVIRRLLSNREGEVITSRDIVDICNLTGKAVVAGGSRRSAILSLGDKDDIDFINLKNWNLAENKDRMAIDGTGWGQLSNNTIVLHDGEFPQEIVDSIMVNGEPGIFNIDMAREMGRLIDGRDHADMGVKGINPCAEATLESSEVCNLNELFPYHHESLDDFKRSIKHAYLYCKAVTLLPTDWPETNEVLTRNRRIGTSVAGVAQFIEDRGRTTLRRWLDEGYKTIKERDKQYSEWLGIRESIKVSVVKPGGTVPLLCGATPGVHWPVASHGYIRRQRFRRDDPLLAIFVDAGYHVEDSVSDENDAIVEFYTKGPKIRTEREVSVWEKVSTAVMMQRYWADQAVSATFTFTPEEAKDVGHVIAAYGDQLKTLSFMPLGEELEGGAYKQMPYEAISEEDFEKKYNAISKMSLEDLYNGKTIQDVQADKFCTTDRCEI